MSWLKSSAAAAAALVLAAQPCAAADDLRSTGAVERRSGAFAGMAVRMPIGRQGEKPSARLQLATVHHAYDRESRLSARSSRPSGLELGLSGSARPALYIGGRNAAEVERKLQVKGSGLTVLLVGGAILISVLLLASLADAMPTPGPGEGDFD